MSLVLIESKDDEGVIHEFLVGKKWIEECFEPNISHSDRRIMSITGHIGSDEHPLRELVVLQVLKEYSVFLIFARRSLLLVTELYRISGLIMCQHCLKIRAREPLLVLVNVVISTIHLVDLFKPLKTRVWYVFLVYSPADPFVLKEIDNGRHILGDGGEWITIESEIIPSNNGYVVRLGWMGHGG